ncbi:13088_t:CDS:2 [Dentiscutata erythropus]|uniref:D-arabinono-1,4-lactone oxidase n=1 Tax=Dentiscutata erythropus TaxID=1348616 RepID=A0A9N8VT97_9GLOM|nr:13088_t:CDS:2 [Dentiscutata erythropus]
MSNPKVPDIQWFEDSLKELVKAKDDKEKTSIIDKLRTELFNLESTKKFLGENAAKYFEELSKKRNEKLPAITNYPETEEEIQKIVEEAYKDGNTIVRVVGSGHSISDAIIDKENKKIVLISLKKFNGVEFISDDTVKVKAGTHLNQDPQDDTSNLSNSLNYIINERGYAFPDLGGIAHQTVGGFLSTGSSGGSSKYSLEESVISINIINGKGELKELTRPNDDFFAAGVSMGLFGIITYVTFKLNPNYYIYGSQVSTFVDEGLNSDYQKGCPIDLFGSTNKPQDVPSLYDFFANGSNYDAEYSRLLWWPQTDVNRFTIWKAKRTEVLDLKGFTKPTAPYLEFNEILGSQIPEQIIAHIAYVALNILYLIDDDTTRKIAALILSFFSGVVQQAFQDIWYNGLPMDDKVSDTILPTTFTELWFQIRNADDTNKIMNKLKDYFASGDSATGNNATEIYTTKKSEFWLSPSYDYENVIRIDFFYFLGNKVGDPNEFFEKCCKVFDGFEYRCHWGKYIPDNYKVDVNKYSKYNQWMAIREQMDPNQIFVTQYWRKVLNIEPQKK